MPVVVDDVCEAAVCFQVILREWSVILHRLHHHFPHFPHSIDRRLLLYPIVVV